MRAVMVCSLAMFLVPVAAVGAPQDPDVRIDPRADAAMRSMSDYLTSLGSFRFHGSSVTDVVTHDGQKIQVVAAQNVELKRPNRLRTERQDPRMDAVVRYDGRQLSVYGKRTGYYATAPMPPRIDDAVDVARRRYGIDAPAADLFGEHPYDTLMEDVVVGHYIGLEPIEGIPCHHLAFQGRDVDWQIWIEDGERPLPRRYVITSKHDPTQPEFGVMLTNWEPNARIADHDFVFQPPPGATRIELLSLTQPRSGRRGGAR
jgi:hypothetical protein